MDMTAGSDAVCDTCGNFMAKHGSRMRLAPVENATPACDKQRCIYCLGVNSSRTATTSSTIIFIVQYFIVSCTDCLLLSFLSVFCTALLVSCLSLFFNTARGASLALCPRFAYGIRGVRATYDGFPVCTWLLRSPAAPLVGRPQ